MGEDVISFGPGRSRRAEQAIESLFRAWYPHLVLVGYALTSDQDLAEQLAARACLRLWRRWRPIADPRAARARLRRAVVRLSGTRAMTEAQLDQRLRDLPPGEARRRVDTGAAWQRLQALRSRSARRRRIAMAGCAAAAVIAVRAATLTTAHPHDGNPDVPASAGPHTRQDGGHLAFDGYGPHVAYRQYPGAVTERIVVGGGEVLSLTRDGDAMWAVLVFSPAAYPHFELARIDPRTGVVTLLTALGENPGVVAAAGGRLWMTNPADGARDQVVRIDPVTGKITGGVHLKAGHCGYLTSSGGELWAECGSGSWRTAFLRLDPATGQVLERLGPVRGPIGGQIAITPQGVWYYDNYSGLNGIMRTGGRQHIVTVRDIAYPVGFVFTRSLAYAQGALWVLTGDERVAKVDPGTGRLLRIFTYRSYDPGRQGGLDFLTAGQGSLWFIDDGYPFSGVLRVAMSTGKPLGGVPIKPGACYQPCWQIYDAGGAIWVPTVGSLLRIDPARLPG